jgi:hypothetical protein
VAKLDKSRAEDERPTTASSTTKDQIKTAAALQSVSHFLDAITWTVS